MLEEYTFYVLTWEFCWQFSILHYDMKQISRRMFTSAIYKQKLWVTRPCSILLIRHEEVRRILSWLFKKDCRELLSELPAGKKQKRACSFSLPCTVRFDLASDGGSYWVQVQGVTDVCYLFIKYVLLTNGILVSLLE